MKAYQTHSAGRDHVLHSYAYNGVIHRIEVLRVVTSTHPDDLLPICSVSPDTQEEAEQLIRSAKATRWWE